MHAQMTHRQHVDDVQTMHGRCADDMHVTPGAVLHEIQQLRQEQLCIKPKMVSLFRITLPSIFQNRLI